METISFWDKVPLPSFLTVLWAQIFADKVADPRRLQSSSKPDPVEYQIVQTHADATAVADFLRANYNTGSAKEHPISTITATDLLGSSSRTVYLRLGKQLCGSVSSLPLGSICRGSSTTPSAFNLRLIQNFCVAKGVRKKGIGSKLLHAIWNDTHSINEDATIFLKEGVQLLTAGPPLYSSRWVYRRCNADETQSSNCQQIATCSSSTTSLIADFCRSNSHCASTHILYNNPKEAPNTILIVYKGLRGSILSAFASAKQIHPSNHQPIWYQTGWLEQGTILPTERQFAAMYISSKCASITKCGWIWLDAYIFKETPPPPLWKHDGPFHYYAFHWTADIYNNATLFLRF